MGSRYRLWVMFVVLALIAAACGSGAVQRDPASAGPPITESETGRVIGQPVDVEAFQVDVTEEGTAVFSVSGSVPSRCHEAIFGFEEPDADGVMVGTAESWLDPACALAGGPTAFSVSMELTTLAPGEYVARLDGEFEAPFSIPPDVVAEPKAVEDGAWRPMPAGPLGGREEAHVFWTGSELLVMGGSDATPCPPGADCVSPDVSALRDGAAFDPVTGEWREIAPSPVPLGYASGLVQRGVVYLWAHGFETRPGTESAFLAYDIEEDLWERLPMPERMLDSVTLGKVGDLLILYQSTQENGVSSDLLFDPQTREWSVLPEDPLQPSFGRTTVWTGDELVLLGIEVVPQPGSAEPAFYRAAAYNVATGSWLRLPDSEVIGWSPIWYKAAGRIINPSVGSSDGGEVNNYGRFYPHGGMLDPVAGVWEPLPDAPEQPAGFTGYTAANSELLLNYEGWVLDASARRWLPVDAPPDGALEGSAVTWAGADLIVWGGVAWTNTDGELLDTGWIWRPDR